MVAASIGAPVAASTIFPLTKKSWLCAVENEKNNRIKA
tara:strand:- start:408 stop:521 length:114 start_codon:yes stop_codon:yes gene_type:complete